MFKFLVRRCLVSIPVVVAVVTLVFLMLHLIPGDPIDLMLGDTALAADKAELRSRLGLDLPLWKQYLSFWWHLLEGTWGWSITYDRAVLPLILERLGPTLILSCFALLLGLMGGLPLGVLAASKSGTATDTAAVGVALLGMSVPIFVLGPLAILVFSVHLGWLPVSGSGTFWHLLIPGICLGFSLSGMLTRMVRTCVLECLGEDYVRTARAKGLGQWPVLFRHTLRNAMIPVLTILGNMLGGLLAGAVITETLFDWPGIGKLFFSAFQGRDYPLVQGVVLWIAISYVGVNLLVDVLYSAFDPRVRLEG